MTTGLTFNTLRAANTARLPLFLNKHGEPAHSLPDGSDWSPAMWFTALLGELGELAETRVLYEAGDIDWDTYRGQVQAEAADVQTYLDIFCRRCLDLVHGKEQPADFAQQLMQITSELGQFANHAKKLVRGDYNTEQYARATLGTLDSIINGVHGLHRTPVGVFHPVSQPHQTGINLGEATIVKFNEVSKRVKCEVFIASTGDRYTRPKE